MIIAIIVKEITIIIFFIYPSIIQIFVYEMLVTWKIHRFQLNKVTQTHCLCYTWISHAYCHVTRPPKAHTELRNTLINCWEWLFMHSLASSSSLHSKQLLNEPLVLTIKSFIGESNRDQTTGLPVLDQAHKPPKVTSRNCGKCTEACRGDIEG